MGKRSPTFGIKTVSIRFMLSAFTSTISQCCFKLNFASINTLMYLISSYKIISCPITYNFMRSLLWLCVFISNAFISYAANMRSTLCSQASGISNRLSTTAHAVPFAQPIIIIRLAYIALHNVGRVKHSF